MNRKYFAIIFIMLLAVTIEYPVTAAGYEFQYNLKSPAQSYTLPDILHEISGITIVNDNELACVQDEKGIVFIYNFDEKKIVKQYEFHGDGDYEGLAKVDKTLYILRSDGMIYEYINYESKKPKLKKHHVKLPALNNEGICYDSDNNRLLLACKSHFINKKESKSKRAIYSFDLKKNKLDKTPVFEILLTDIQTFLDKEKIYKAKESKKIKKFANRKMKFNPSEIAIHPMTKELYLLSALEHLLYIFNLEGDLLHVEVLDQNLFLKAEGISFDVQGNLYISNEGKNLKPTLLMFLPG